MDIESILGNLIASALFALLSILAKKAYVRLKAALNAASQINDKTRPIRNRKILKKQFFGFLTLLLLSLIVFCSTPASDPSSLSGFLKVISGLFSGLSFLAVWGAFDAAFAFYPSDDNVDVPANTKANDDVADKSDDPL